MPNRILYGGQQYDPETGQCYLRARYYNPVVGRFLQEDPYHGDGLNLYAYCSDNPVTYYDPSGYGREHNSRAKENVKKENVTVKQGENGSQGGRGAVNGKGYRDWDGEIPRSGDEWYEYLKNKYGEGNITKNFISTSELENHIIKTDTSVPVKRGIGGAHNELEFLKNDVQIIDSISSTTVPGVSQIEYNMPKLDGSTYPATPIPGEYGTAVYKKTVYDPYIIGDGEFIQRGLEAANNAMLPDGSLPGVWSGFDSLGVEWIGYFRNGKIDSFFPSN